jgi:regulator of cell morphogenesis and NO signaling
MNVLDAQATVGQLVRERPSRARVFERFGIDYCCGGKRPLDEACRKEGLDLGLVLDALADPDPNPLGSEAVDWSAVPMGELADHIEATHHVYLRHELPRLAGLLEKVVAAHGRNHHELWDVRVVFAGLKAELEEHMLKEERVLFPMVRQLERATTLPRFHCGSVGNPIVVMEHEHDAAGAALASLRTLTDGYTPPAGACNTYRALFDGLASLEADLHLHIHKENNILFPRARDAEAALALEAVR